MSSEPAPTAPLTQTYMDNSLKELRAKIGSLKTEFKFCIHVVKIDIGDLGERINDMEQTLDAQTDDLEALSCRVVTLEEQQLDIHLKQEVLESNDRRNNIHIWGVPEGVEGPDIMPFVADLLQAIRRDPDTPTPMLD
ncbi:hypothetical protein NDU88_005417 [Pleurodeles waltl]|uniref:Uncharacterized protein n=1 Tax=Pleurodeles waltl TaxID=8319 RepID=A0AAV7NQ81_PLEWA|nr:hypothetical protein NDU88_005417 [Pleurodeles waltl]